MRSPSGSSRVNEVDDGKVAGSKPLLSFAPPTHTPPIGDSNPPPRTTAEPPAFSGDVIAYGFWMRTEGYSETTIERYVRLLKELAKHGELHDPESVKIGVTRTGCAGGTKEMERRSIRLIGIDANARIHRYNVDGFLYWRERENSDEILVT